MSGAAARLLRWWVRLYTSGLPSGERGERRDEIESNHHEHTHSFESRDGNAVWQVLGRMVRGLPADVAWRLSRSGAERRAARGGAAAASRGGGAVALVAYRSYAGVIAAAVAAVLMAALIVTVVLIDRAGDVARGEMAEARVLHVAAPLADGGVLAAGGKTRYGSCELGADCHDPAAAAEVYDPASGVWSAAAPMSVPRQCAAATTLVDGRVLVAGGALVTNAALLERGGTGAALRTAEVYDPSSDTWSSAGATEIERHCPVAVRLPDGRALLTGGLMWRAPDLPMAVADIFDPASGEWASADSMNDRRVGHKAVLLRDGRVLVIGGADRRHGLNRWNAMASTELYDPSTDRWTRTGDMAQRRASPTVTLLRDGRVLVAGGLDAATRSLASAEVYDPGSGTWSPVDDMLHRRAFHAAVLLDDGTVLVTGGNVDEEDAIPYAEVFDPRSGSWSEVEGLAAPRQSHSMVALPGGRVIVVGGSATADGAGHFRSEVYDPVAGRWSRY